MLVNTTLFEQFQTKVKQPLKKFKDLLAWSYKELKRILKSICEHKIKLIVDAHPFKQ